MRFKVLGVKDLWGTVSLGLRVLRCRSRVQGSGFTTHRTRLGGEKERDASWMGEWVLNAPRVKRSGPRLGLYSLSCHHPALTPAPALALDFLSKINSSQTSTRHSIATTRQGRRVGGLRPRAAPGVGNRSPKSTDWCLGWGVGCGVKGEGLGHR